MYGRSDAAEGLLQFKHYWNKLSPSKRRSTLCSTGGDVNIMAVGGATPITIVNLPGVLLTFAAWLRVRCCGPREHAREVCVCEVHAHGAELHMSLWFVRTWEIKLYMLLPISTAVTVHRVLRSASLLKRGYLCGDSRECENWGEGGRRGEGGADFVR